MRITSGLSAVSYKSIRRKDKGLVAMSEMVFKKFCMNNTRRNNHLLTESRSALCGRTCNQTYMQLTISNRWPFEMQFLIGIWWSEVWRWHCKGSYVMDIWTILVVIFWQMSSFAYCYRCITRYYRSVCSALYNWMSQFLLLGLTSSYNEKKFIFIIA